jgi:hypothetical protein
MIHESPTLLSSHDENRPPRPGLRLAAGAMLGAVAGGVLGVLGNLVLGIGLGVAIGLAVAVLIGESADDW